MHLKNFEPIVMRDLKGEATDKEIEWLMTPSLLPLWYKRLLEIDEDLKLEIGTRRLAVKVQQVQGVKNQPAEYLLLKSEFDEWHLSAMTLQRALVKRFRDVETLMAAGGIDFIKPAAITILLRTLNVLDYSDTEGARRYLSKQLQLWAEEEGVLVELPD
jgi:hypothetical protein